MNIMGDAKSEIRMLLKSISPLQDIIIGAAVQLDEHSQIMQEVKAPCIQQRGHRPWPRLAALYSDHLLQ